MEPGLIAGLGLAASTVTGLVKTASRAEPPSWLSAALVSAVSLTLVALGVYGGEIKGSPLDVALWSIEVALAGMGGRAALQAGYQQTTGKALELRPRAQAPTPPPRVMTGAARPMTVLGFSVLQSAIATCPLCGSEVALEEGSSGLHCSTGHALALDVPYRADRPLDYFYRVTVAANS